MLSFLVFVLTHPCEPLFPISSRPCPPTFSPLVTRHSPLSPLESALPRPLAYNPCRMNTSKKPQICIKTKDFNPIRMNTSKTARRVLKTKDFKSTRMNTYAISHRNPFRIRTSKKRGEGGMARIPDGKLDRDEAWCSSRVTPRAADSRRRRDTSTGQSGPQSGKLSRG